MMFLIESSKRDMKTVEWAKNSLNTDEALWDIAAYHSQQAIEKLLKAILEIKGIEYKKTHDIAILAAQVQNSGTILDREIMINASLITNWESTSRYHDSFMVLVRDLDIVNDLYNNLLKIAISVEKDSFTKGMSSFDN